MREIKFRGKAIVSIEELELMNIKHNNGWVYGNLIKNGNRPMITADILEEIDESIYPEWWVVVEPKSVGQYTGLKDRNGKEIYDGDILLCTGKKGYWQERETVYKKSVIEWWQSHCNLGYRLRDGRGKTLMVKPSSLRTMQAEVIGNIYENPELLEGKK